MNRSTRRISMLLVLTMVLGLLAAFPMLSVGAADTNYASGLTATFTKDGAEGAIQGGVITALTDGTLPTDETAADSVWFAGTGASWAFTFDLGSTKTDLSSVYVYARVIGNRGFDAKGAKVEVSNDNATFTAVSATTSLTDNATANYKDFNINFTSVVSGRYVKVTLVSDQYILSLGEIEIRNYGLSSGSQASEATADPTLVDGNYAYGATYTVTKNDAEPTYRNAQMTDGGNWLTDGYEGANPTNNGSAYYTVAYTGTGAAYVFTLNLAASKSDIAMVTLVNVPAPGDSFKDPTNVVISTSTDGLTYNSVGTLTTSSVEKNAGGAYDLSYSFSAKSGKYVQISLTSPAYLLGFDEIVIKGSGAVVADPDPIIPADPTLKTSTSETNYAASSKGAYYSYTNIPVGTNVTESYWMDNTWSRPSGVIAGKWGQGQLNDGTYATGSYNDEAWVAWIASLSNVEIIFDLAGVYGDIDQIAFTTLAHGGDVEQYECVNSISVSFGDFNGNYGAATTYTATVTETAVTAADGKVATYYRSQFGAKGPATGARFVKISIPKATYRLFIDEIEIFGASGFEGSSTPSVPDSSVSTPDSSEVDDGSYVLDRDFKVDVSAAYGEFDTDKDGTNDFTGIAVDVYVNDITYDRGLLGIEGFLNFDNTKLQPLYVTDADLNGTTIDNPPKTILNWPTFSLFGMTPYAIEGLCQSYSMADGSTTDPANPEATFSKNDSRMRIRYILHTDYYEGYTNGTSIGVKEDGAMALRYYFIVPEGSEGQTFTFTVPDTPKATHISECALYAPMSYINDAGTISYSSVYGFGGSASVTIEEPVKEYTVTFVGKDGETLKTETVEEGSAATAPEAPVVEGFEFKGWDVDFTNVTTDLTVTAIYEEVAAPAEFFTFADGADTTYVALDRTNNYIYFCKGAVSVANLKALFVDADVKVFKGTAERTSGNVGTAFTVTSTIGSESKTITVIVKGDLDGNGSINSRDQNAAQNHVAGTAALTGEYLIAADVSAPLSGNPNARDANAIAGYIAGTTTSFTVPSV